MTLADLFTPARRGYLHAVAVAVLAFIGVVTQADPASGPLIVAVVIAVFDLGVALLHSTKTWRSAVYGLAIAAQALAVFLHIGTDVQWSTGLALVAAVLGGGLAAAKTPA